MKVSQLLQYAVSEQYHGDGLPPMILHTYLCGSGYMALAKDGESYTLIFFNEQREQQAEADLGLFDKENAVEAAAKIARILLAPKLD